MSPRARRAGFAAAGAGGLVAVAILAGGRGGPATAEGVAAAPVPIPAPARTDLGDAARAAGCVLRVLPEEGRGHSTAPVRYRSAPPSSGDHLPSAADDGAYPPAAAPTTGAVVHALEHGRVVFQWRPGAAPRDIGRLQTLHAENRGRHSLLVEDRSGMRFAVAATAWRHLLGCPRIDDPALDALRAFRRVRIDQGLHEG